MIITLKKYVFVGAKEELDHFFEAAQHQGFFEFISIRGKKNVDTPPTIQNLLQAHKILRKLPVKPQSSQSTDLVLAQQLARHIIYLAGAVEKLQEQVRLTKTEMARVHVFGDFSLEDIHYIEETSHRKMQFFCMKSNKADQVELPAEMIYVGTEFDLDYFIALSSVPKQYPNMIEMRVDRPLGDLREDLKMIKESLHDVELELKNHAAYLEFLQNAYIEELNRFNLESAKKDADFPLENTLFAIEAWIPSNKTGKLYGLLDGMAIHCEEVAVSSDEQVPTCLENKGAARIGEDLILIYDVPSPNDKDPSLWVLISFILFFSIIISDAGYGLIYLAIAGFIKYKIPHLSGAGKRMHKLFTYLACGCIAWGVISSSYFGMNIHPDSSLGKLSVINYLGKKKIDYDHVHHPLQFAKTETNQSGNIKYEMLTEYTRSVILELSLMIGVIHLSLAFLRYLRRNWSGIGWIIFMIGGYLYFPSVLKATSLVQALGWVDSETATRVGQEMVYAGIGIAIGLALIRNRWSGLKEIPNLVQIFADVLSYLRLYALALASAIMAETFNGIGNYIGFFAGLVAMIIGHGANLVLGTGSGVIHGLRLNMIEWYHYCFEGGGRLFKPLVKLKK